MARILICDDEAGLRAVIKRYAIFEGHQVIEVDDGFEAVEICQNNTFDIIIMDVMMPKLDGFSAVKEYNVHACQDTKFNFLVMNSFREFYAAA